MESLVNNYNQRDENDVLRSEVYEEMTEQLTELIWDVYKAFKSGYGSAPFNFLESYLPLKKAETKKVR